LNKDDCGGNGNCETMRLQCLQKTGIEPGMPRVIVNGQEAAGDYPRFTRGGDNFADKVSHAIKRAEDAVNSALHAIGNFFAQIGQAIGDWSHFFHSFNKCFDESGRFGRDRGNDYMNSAHQKADQFWKELGPALDELTLDERHKAVDGPWGRLKAGILGQRDSVRESDKNCGRVRGWFTKSGSKQRGHDHCRDEFNGHTTQLEQSLDGTYSLHINNAVPPAHVAAHAATAGRPTHSARMRPGHVDLVFTKDHDANVKLAEQHADAELAACKPRSPR
jgi:hypothetical protein